MRGKVQAVKSGRSSEGKLAIELMNCKTAGRLIFIPTTILQTLCPSRGLAYDLKRRRSAFVMLRFVGPRWFRRRRRCCCVTLRFRCVCVFAVVDLMKMFIRRARSWRSPFYFCFA